MGKLDIHSKTFNGKNGFNGNGHSKEKINGFDSIGDHHVATSIETPLRKDAFKRNDEEKMAIIEDHFREIMEVIGLDLNDDSLQGTPHRVAKMFVQEIFYGLNPANKPKISVFDNKFKYGEMLVEKNINMNSFCEHHFLPIWQGACRLHFKWRGNRIKQDQPDCRLLCTPSAGPGTPDCTN